MSIANSFNIAVNLTAAGSILEIASNISSPEDGIVGGIGRIVVVLGQTSQNIASVLPCATALATWFLAVEAPAFIKLSAGAGLGILGLGLGVVSLLPAIALLYEMGILRSSTEYNEYDGEYLRKKDIQIKVMLGEYASSALKVLNLGSMLTAIVLGKVAPPIGIGIEMLSGIAFGTKIFQRNRNI